MDEFFAAYKDAYKRDTYFIYGYVVVAITMMKWCLQEGQNLAEIPNGEYLTLMYPPWQA